MKIKIKQFLFGKSYSWSIVGQELGRSFLNLGHEVDFISTDGFDKKYCPDDLLPHNKVTESGSYDIALSYTQPHNWGAYTDNSKNRFVIWNYEYCLSKNAKKGTLLPGFAKHHKDVDFVFPSSKFSKQVFLDMGVPDDKLVVVPHGFNTDQFLNKENCWKLKTKKTKKILLNLNQPHVRKAIPLALDAYGKAFTKDDDVCLIAKVYTKNAKKQQFDVDFYKMLKDFKKKFKNHAEVEVVTDYITNIADLYNSCDINFTATHAECYHLPSAEAIASGLINIVPNYGGQLDFCNKENSLLISGSEVRAPRNAQYWLYNSQAVHFKIDVDDAVKRLREAVFDYDSVKERLSQNRENFIKENSWDIFAQQIIDLAK